MGDIYNEGSIRFDTEVVQFDTQGISVDGDGDDDLVNVSVHPLERYLSNYGGISDIKRKNAQRKAV